MRAVVQRVSCCSVSVDNEIIGSIDSGLLVYLGVEHGDTGKDTVYLAEKISGLRIFRDSSGKMNLSVKDCAGKILVISQFTLCADTRKGKRPSYNNAAHPDTAQSCYMDFISLLRKKDIEVEEGRFGASMDVAYTNNGPVTILVDSKKTF